MEYCLKMATKPLARRGAYKNLTQTELASFAENVFKRISTKPEYQAFSTDITLLEQQVELYSRP